MADLTIETLRNLSQLSQLKLNDKELEMCMHDIGVLLDYIDRIRSVSVDSGLEPVGVINVFRDDKIVVNDSTSILSEAPDHEGDYFVVPKVLD